MQKSILRRSRTGGAVRAFCPMAHVGALFSSCFSERKYQRKLFALDTVIDITVYASHDPEARRKGNARFAACAGE
jgi:hypothetical protein